MPLSEKASYFDWSQREAIFERYDVVFDQPLDDRVEVLHAVEFAITHRIEQRLAFNFTGFDVLARTRTRPQNLDGRDTAAPSARGISRCETM